MTNADRVIAALREHGSLSDSELVRITGIRPHQQVNQLCRRLEAKGALRRVPNAGGTIINVLVAGADPLNSAASPPSARPGRSSATRASGRSFISIASSCWQSRVRLALFGPQTTRRQSWTEGRHRLRLAPLEPGRPIGTSPPDVEVTAAVDESLLLPAWQRYDGTFYQAAGDGVRLAIADGVTVLVISGGYGLVIGQEPIGFYERPLLPHRLATRLARRVPRGGHGRRRRKPAARLLRSDDGLRPTCSRSAVGGLRRRRPSGHA